MYIGLISDTHGEFSDEFRTFLAPVDELWHAGDIGGGQEFIEELLKFKPLIAVYGNCDGRDARLCFPEYQFFEREGMKVLMTHIGGTSGHYDPKARALLEAHRPDIFVCGHSHILKVMHDRRFDMMYVNPGAAGVMGWHPIRTALRFRLEKGDMKDMEVFNLERHGGQI